MRFSFFTLFPDLIMPYFGQSIMRNAICNQKIEVECINIRDYAFNKHKKVDNALIGGGAGMLLDPFVLDCALQQARDSRIIFLSPCGARFSHKDSVRLSKYSHISFVCGRYEGFDERSIELHATEIFSIGDFILSGGELGALCMADSIARHIHGVLGNELSLQGESFESGLLEAPNFTKSKQFAKKNQENLPTSAYLNGNHAIITDLKLTMSKMKTQYFRPDLLTS